MNRLKVRDGSDNILLGGMPFDLEDIDWMDDSVRKAFFGFISAFGITPATSFILSGCSNDGVNNVAGFICLNGEVLPVDAAALPSISGSNFRYWDLEVSYDTRGTENFQSGASYNTYEVRKGKIVVGAPAAGTYMPLNAPLLLDLIAQYTIDHGAFATRQQENWHIVDDPGEPAFENSWINFNASLYGPLRFRKDQFNHVIIEGAVKDGTIGGSTPIFHLPAGYRPAYRKVFIIPSDNSTSTPQDSFQRVNIHPDGKVVVTSNTPAVYLGDNAFIGIPNLRFALD